MSAKAELHDLVDRLADTQAAEALAYLRDFLGATHPLEGSPNDRLTQRMGPRAVPGTAFFSQPQADSRALAARQGARPPVRFDDLLGDFWPEDETVDEFVAAVRQWRHEGGYA